MAECDYWITQAGDTLEAYITVPALLPYLDQQLFNDIQRWRKTKAYVSTMRALKGRYGQ